ncbi:unnamed protein product [Closterium sp. NIES-54]
MITTTTLGGQRVSICTYTPTGRHLATFTRRPGSILCTLATEPPQVGASAQVSASGQVAPPCSCRLVSHQTLLWHHCLGHPSLPRLRGIHSHLLISGLPRSLPPLPPSPAPPCLPCVEGRQRASPHSSSFPLRTTPLQTLHMDVKGEVIDVLIPWIRAIRLQLRERFHVDLPVLRLHSYRGGDFCSDLLRDFCRGEGILHSFTLPASPQQNGIAERRIGLVMEPCVSFPETSPTLLWTVKVDDASVFWVWGSRAFVCDTSADKLSARAIPCDITCLPLAPFPFTVSSPTALPLPCPRRSSLLQVDPLLGTAPIEVVVGLGAARRAASGGAETGVAESEGAGSRGAEPGDEEPGGVELGGAESEGAESGAPPSDESIEPSGPYLELMGCLMYLMTCTRPDLAYPLCLLARNMAPGRHRKVHWDAAKRVLHYLCSTSGMGLVFGGRVPVVLTGHTDATWVDNSAMQRSSKGYTFSLSFGSVTRSSSVLSSSCEAEIYARAMAAQELCWLTYLLTDLGEQPCSTLVLTLVWTAKGSWILQEDFRRSHEDGGAATKTAEGYGAVGGSRGRGGGRGLGHGRGFGRGRGRVQVTVSHEEISEVTEDGGEPEVEEEQQQQQQQQQHQQQQLQQDAPPRTQRSPDRPRRDMDITNALFNGIILEELYMLQPEGLDDGSGRVCRLKKDIYGLKQAPRPWHHKLEETLLAGGFKKSEYDLSLFLLQEKEQFLMLMVYVDNILLFSESFAMIERLEEMLEMQFKCLKMGDVRFYLGMHVERDLDKGVLRLHHRKYCEGLAEKYGLQDGGKPATPLPSGLSVEPYVDEEVVGGSDSNLFHSMVGALNYAANHTRPDIAFVTSRLASVVSRPSHEQLEVAKRLVRFVSATASVGLEYSAVRQRQQRGAADFGKGEMLLTCYTDASFNSVNA